MYVRDSNAIVNSVWYHHLVRRLSCCFDHQHTVCIHLLLGKAPVRRTERQCLFRESTPKCYGVENLGAQLLGGGSVCHIS